MYGVRFVLGAEVRAVAREFGLSRDTVRKMLQYGLPPTYKWQQPIKRPKLRPWLGGIDAILDDDKQSQDSPKRFVPISQIDRQTGHQGMVCRYRLRG